MAIMVEISCILAIVTKEMKLDRMCKPLLYRHITNDGDVFSKTQKLNQLTQEEARMATAQALKSTHTFDDRVRWVMDKVLGINDTVAAIDDRAVGVDDIVAGVDDKVKGRRWQGRYRW